MNRIFFRNTKKWTSPYAVVYNNDESISEKIRLTECDNEGDLFLEFDSKAYSHLYFSGDEAEKTSLVYPGDLSIGVEYKNNEKMGKDLTFLFSKGNKISGRVENFVIEDAKNLSHREDKSKKISVFLPESYDGKTPHDILYFFDAQNLFCNAGSYTECGDPYGSWQVDVVLKAVHRQFGRNTIVVGIDNADMYRSQELFMDSTDFGRLSPLAYAIPEDDFSHGYLDGLSSFMVSTLHKFIKEKYCVCEDNIGLGGSSMGGIASFYCGLKERGFYKYILSYSPAFGLYEKEAFENYFEKQNFLENEADLPKIHIYCGGGDMLEEQLLPLSREMKSLMVSHGYNADKIFERYDSEKPHNEESWRLILPESFSLLLDL